MEVRRQGILARGQTGTLENRWNEHSVAWRSEKNGQLKWRLCVGEEKKDGLPVQRELLKARQWGRGTVNKAVIV